MSYLLDDPRLPAALDAWLTQAPDDCADYEAMTAEIDAAEARDATLARLRALRANPAEVSAFLARIERFVASPDEDDASDIERGSYFTPGVTQATGALEPCETCPPDSSLCSDCFIGDEPTCPACYLARSEHTPQMLRACAVVLARLAAFERSQNAGAA